MPSSYSNLLGIELIQTGEQSGNWGNTTNNNLGTLLEQAIAAQSDITVSGSSYTLVSAPNGTAYESRSMALRIIGTLSVSCNVVCPAKQKLYVVRNATTGGQNIVMTTGSGTTVTVANGATAIVYCDGTNVIEAGDTMSGGLGFTGTATRIQGDFSNATLANRTAFQDKTTNNGTSVYALPNGTSNEADFTAFNNSTPTNAAYAGVGVTLTEASVYTSVSGSGTSVPLALKVGITRVIIRTNGVFDFFNSAGTNIARLDASGNFSVIGNVTAYAAI